MQKTIIILTICTILIGSLIFIYLKFQPMQKQTFNVSISAKEENKKIETGFIIESLNIIGNTSESYETYNLPMGEITIKNINIENQKYYENEKTFEINKNTRIDLILEEPQEITYKIEENNSINITLYSKNFKEIDFCLFASFNYYSIKSQNFTEINLDNDADICYDGNFSLIDNSQEIIINYKKFQESHENDFIDLVLIDKQQNEQKIRIK